VNRRHVILWFTETGPTDGSLNVCDLPVSPELLLFGIGKEFLNTRYLLSCAVEEENVFTLDHIDNFDEILPDILPVIKFLFKFTQ
jgi:phospholipid N-methyltransferase